MVKLIQLELRKFKLHRNIYGFLIANAVILCIMLAVSYMGTIESEIPLKNIDMAFSVLDTFIRAVFIIYTSALIAKVIIGEFKGKTATVLFMYPINRYKLMFAKLIIITLFCFLSILLSSYIQLFLFSMYNSIMQFVPGSMNTAFFIKYTPTILVNAIASSAMCYIALYVGMRKFSLLSTVISGVIIATIVCQYIGEASLNTIIIIPITLALIGAVAAYLSIRKIGKMDIL